MEIQLAQMNDQLLREDIQKDGSYSLLQLMRRRRMLLDLPKFKHKSDLPTFVTEFNNYCEKFGINDDNFRKTSLLAAAIDEKAMSLIIGHLKCRPTFEDLMQNLYKSWNRSVGDR